MSVYHVSKQGDNHFDGSQEHPFLTISQAAGIAQAGDSVVVHEGVYREWVSPKYGGRSNTERIIYEAAPGEKVIIKGSEQISSWTYDRDGVWKAVVSNTLFGDYNPYATEVYGDWLEIPAKRRLHAGDVYLNGKSFYEAESLDDVYHPEIRKEGCKYEWMVYAIPFEHPEDTLNQWYAVVDDDVTTIYANFHDQNPNQALTEINVRKCCFYPKELGRNYITVRGFEMAQAACSWAPPTADQPGLIGPHWAKGWIIEDNIIHDAKCSAVSLGKEISTGHNECTYTHRKPGYQYQLEAVFKAREIGWSMEKIGSHIVRRNTIYDCGQNAVVGHLGCIHSEITDNHIYHIGTKREFFGWEISGIKLHASLDCFIARNVIHDCVLGTWLDWQAQGVRVSSNIYYRNDRDLMVEVSHGPYLVDNNIFGSDHNIENASQGGAYVHNLFRTYLYTFPVLNRSTPYHFPHSTKVAGFALIYGGDDRFYQNIFAGGYEGDCSYADPAYYVGTSYYDGCPTSLEEYAERVVNTGVGDVEMFEKVRQPYYSGGNVFFGKARPSTSETDGCQIEAESGYCLTESDDGIYLDLEIPEEFGKALSSNRVITTEILGSTRITECAFENPDGTSLSISKDLLGQARSGCPVSGPLESLHPGKNHIKISSLIIKR